MGQALRLASNFVVLDEVYADFAGRQLISSHAFDDDGDETLRMREPRTVSILSAAPPGE